MFQMLTSPERSESDDEEAWDGVAAKRGRVGEGPSSPEECWRTSLVRALGRRGGAFVVGVRRTFGAPVSGHPRQFTSRPSPKRSLEATKRTRLKMAAADPRCSEEELRWASPGLISVQ